MAWPENMVGNASNLNQAERFPPSTLQTLTAPTQIAPSGNFLPITAGSAITLTGTPTITTGFPGQQIVITNEGANPIIFQDQALLANSGLRLWNSQIALQQYRSITLIYDATLTAWTQVGVQPLALYRAKANLTAGQSIGSGAFTTVVFDSANYDTNSNYATGTGIYTAPVAGVYTIASSLSITASAGGTTRIISIYVNGSEVSRGNRIPASATGNFQGIGIVDNLLLAAADQVTIRVFQDTGGNLALETGSPQNYFSIHWIG